MFGYAGGTPGLDMRRGPENGCQRVAANVAAPVLTWAAGLLPAARAIWRQNCGHNALRWVMDTATPGGSRFTPVVTTKRYIRQEDLSGETF